MTSTTVPISPQDKVHDVLARDESLVEVFVRAAPHFAKLRNRAMRRVMARLITVEQAARTAKIPTDRLVRELNAALGLADEESGAGATPNPPDAVSLGERHPPNAAVVELDVRDDLRSGREPFSRIMSAVAALRGDEVLRLRAIFEPVPLYSILTRRGFAHEAEAHTADDWSVWFWRLAAGSAETPSTVPTSAGADDVPADDEEHTYLDVRGFSPPEPLMRTLAAIETLARGRTLVQINNRVPQFLFPMLSERGFTWEIDESHPDRVLVHISHAK